MERRNTAKDKKRKNKGFPYKKIARKDINTPLTTTHHED